VPGVCDGVVESPNCGSQIRRLQCAADGTDAGATARRECPIMCGISCTTTVGDHQRLPRARGDRATLLRSVYAYPPTFTPTWSDPHGHPTWSDPHGPT
jgi:hypothetical protein